MAQAVMSVQVKVRGSTDLLIIYHLSDASCFSHYSKENECPQQNITIISITRKKKHIYNLSIQGLSGLALIAEH